MNKWRAVTITTSPEVSPRLRTGPGLTFPVFGQVIKGSHDVEASSRSVCDGVSYWLHIRGLPVLGPEGTAWVCCDDLEALKLSGNVEIYHAGPRNERQLSAYFNATM